MFYLCVYTRLFLGHCTQKIAEGKTIVLAVVKAPMSAVKRKHICQDLKLLRQNLYDGKVMVRLHWHLFLNISCG